MTSRAPGLGSGGLRRCLTLGAFAMLGVACGGGAPLLHPARTLAAGEVRASGGLTANVATGALARDLRRARELSASNAAPGEPGASAEYARGALVVAAVAPGLSPFVAARVGAGQRFEGGLTYTGRSVRADVRRSFDGEHWSLSLGAAGSAALYGRQQGADLAGVDVGSLRGFGAEVPVLVGWQSDGGLYMVWAGARAGFERDVLEALTSEPKAGTPGPMRLSATRVYGAGVIGLATGFRRVHVAVELDVAYQSISGSFNANDVRVAGLTLVPASCLWWSF